MAEIHTLEEICSKTHDILQVATKDLPIPDQSKVRDVRKMISVFTYSIIKELAKDQELFTIDAIKDRMEFADEPDEMNRGRPPEKG